MDSKLDKHWKFAFYVSLAYLQQLVWEFENIASKYKFLYVDVTKPAELISVIQGFLAETDLVNSSEANLLVRMLKTIEDNIEPSYRAGQLAANRLWAESDPETKRVLASLTDEQLRKQAQLQFQEHKDFADKTWFTEGFTGQCGEETIQYVRSIVEDKHSS